MLMGKDGKVFVWSNFGRSLTIANYGKYFFIKDIVINFEFFKSLVQVVTGEKKWRWKTSGDFSCASANGMMHDGGIQSLTQKRLWKIKVPLKVRIFGWLMLEGKILTQHTMLTRWRVIQTGCYLCEEDLIETRDHIIWDCEYTVRF